MNSQHLGCFNKTELQEIVYQLAEGEVRRRLELALKDGWEVNGEAVRAALVNQEVIAGARLVTRQSCSYRVKRWERTEIWSSALRGAGYSQVGDWIMFTSPVHPLQIAGVVFTVVLLALAWASRGRLNSMGFEFLHWNRTSGRENLEALAFGAVCGLAVALLFQALYKGAPFKWQDAWIGVTLGPLMEEAIFRGYLFGLAEWGLRKRSSPGKLDCGNRDRGSIRALSSSETRHHGPADRRDLRDGRRLHLAEDQVAFDDVAVPGALNVQRHYFHGGGASRVK